MATVSMDQEINAKNKQDSSSDDLFDDLSALRYKKEQERKIRKHYLEKFKGDAEAAQKATNQALERIEEQQNKKSLANLKKNLEEKKKYYEEEAQYASKASERAAASAKKFGLEMASSLKDATKKAISNTASAISSGVEKYIGVYDQYMSGIEARIQGSGKSFMDMTSTISRAVGSSQYVSQAKVLEKLNSLVEQGIVYNVEQRAFLGTISEKIAKTFDVANGTLLQLIRIQQADSTAARLGMEAYLTQFLNATFKDTSYLGTQSSAVSSNLLGISSQLGRDRAVELEYVAQKWLGSMSSVGVSSSTIQSISQGLNMLGTGDVSGLSSNQALQRLFVAAASRSGLDYGSLLTGGVDAKTANRLLRGIVGIGQDIAQTENLVVKSQYANLFGMTISDLTSLLNLSSQDLVSISNNMLNYAGAVAEVTNQIEKIPSRMHLSERINTMFENIMTTTGMSIAGNAASYTTWIITDLIEKATGGINIPAISVMGNSVDLNATVTQLMKTGIIGANMLGQIGIIINGLSGANNLSLSNWGAEDVLRRGTGFTGIKIGASKTTSESTYIGGTSGSAIYSESVTSAEDAATQSYSGSPQDTAKEQQENMKIIKESVEKLYQLFNEILREGTRLKVTSVYTSNSTV
ncbi:MAG: hypothetical protein ACI3T9_04780 [Romboutsia timonensis]